MFKPTDPYTSTKNGVLYNNSINGNSAVGLYTFNYEVMYHDNVKINSGGVNVVPDEYNTREYILTISQQIIYFNSGGQTPVLNGNSYGYSNYPVLLETSVLVLEQPGQDIQILGYSPQTVNSQEQTSITSGSSSGTDTNYSLSKTSGSSQSQTNSYTVEVGGSVGAGNMFTCNSSYSYSSTATTDHSATKSLGGGQSISKNSSEAAVMSIKDWAAYSLVNPEIYSTTWTFAQEYPWDVLKCRSGTYNNTTDSPQNSVNIELPQGMANQLFSGDIIFPPSHLALFGFNFVTQCQRKITFQKGVDQVISVNHNLDIYNASHNLSNGNISVSMDSVPSPLNIGENQTTPTSQLDISVIALNPIGLNGASAIVGFLPSKFWIQPSPATPTNPQPTSFCIFSDRNNIKISDTSNYPPQINSGGVSLSNEGLICSLTEDCNAITFTALFKVIDNLSAYALHLKHWKKSGQAIKIEIVVNGNSLQKITKYVDDEEGSGGENNVLSVMLRNYDISSINYIDLINLGLNSIEITFSSDVSMGPSVYALRALSIEAE